MRKISYLSLILIFLSLFLFIVGCAYQQPIVNEEKPKAIPQETIKEKPSDEATTEEPEVIEPGVIQEEELQALRFLTPKR